MIEISRDQSLDALGRSKPQESRVRARVVADQDQAAAAGAQRRDRPGGRRDDHRVRGVADRRRDRHERDPGLEEGGGEVGPVPDRARVGKGLGADGEVDGVVGVVVFDVVFAFFAFVFVFIDVAIHGEKGAHLPSQDGHDCRGRSGLRGDGGVV